MNEALLFIKPHALRNATAVETVFRRLRDAAIEIRDDREVGADVLAAQNTVDRHYAANAAAGLCTDAAALRVSDDVRQSFQQTFGETWEAAVGGGRVLSGAAAQQRLGVSSEELNRIWGACGFTKLAGGLYVGRFPQLNAYVMNGFYPSNRDMFLAPGAAVRLLIVTFDANRLSWQAFRDEVVGATNPAKAAPHSIRGLLYGRQQAAGLTLSYRDNVVHGSASAFEALAEKQIWPTGWPLAVDPLWVALEGAGLSFAQLDAWRTANPIVTVAGKTASLLDQLECLDTEPAGRLLLQLTGDGQLQRTQVKGG